MDKILKLETDKRINVYKIWGGKQLILCKNGEKGTHIGKDTWVLLWPSKSDEGRMLKRKAPVQKTEFYPSDAGYRYLRSIQREEIPNSYIAKVEYVKVNGGSKELWDLLMQEHEFELWNVILGPIKYFEGKKKQLIAIYRVYKMPFQIDRGDVVSDKNGYLPPHNSKKLYGDISKKIINSIDEFEPVINDEDFNRRKKKIIDIIDRTSTSPTYDYRGMSEYIRNYNATSNHKKAKESVDKKKYCIMCGKVIPMKAKYCFKCGENQH